MNVGLFSPYIGEHMGGGERYLLTIAEHLSVNRDCQVELIYSADCRIDNYLDNIQLYESKFGLNLAKIRGRRGPFSPRYSAWDRYRFTRSYDAFLFFTDGSMFFAGSARNILHIQVPLSTLSFSLIDRLKLKSWQVRVANSYFTKRQVERWWRTRVDYVHWGAVNADDFKPGKKRNLILHVGRFFKGLHCKRQDMLVEMFKKLVNQGLKNWRLVLVGTVDPGAESRQYAEAVSRSAAGYPIEIKYETSLRQLKEWYASAKIYWHATGYGIDEELHPELVEHLGLSTVEAMSAGAVPVVISKGGQSEIVSDGVNGFLWENEVEACKKSLRLVTDNKLWVTVSRQAQLRAKDFSKDKFQQMTDKIFNINF